MDRIQGWLLSLLVCSSGGVAAEVNPNESLVLVAYAGFGGTQQFEIEGRVLERENEVSPASLQDGLFDNLWRNMGLLSNDEVAGVTVTLTLAEQSWQVVTDEEGYFRFDVSLPNTVAPGWTPLSLSATGIQPTVGDVLLVPMENTIGIITDLDDTIMVSEVTDTAKLLRNTLLKNPLQRIPVPGTARFIAALATGSGTKDGSVGNQVHSALPIFYLSASPRQLYGNLRLFLDHNAFPRGVLIAKKVSEESDSEPWLNQFAYKTAHIEILLRRFPWMQFILMGDDGEKDPEIYHAIQQHFPERIVGVYIHKVTQDVERPVYAGQADLRQAIDAISTVTKQ